MQIPDAWASLLVSALRDAMLFNEQLPTRETLRDRSDDAEHLVQLSLLFEFVKEEYGRLDPRGRIPLDKLV